MKVKKKKKNYKGDKKIAWMEVFCGEKSTQVYDADTWLPDETIEALKEYIVSIKGPLTTPVGGGIRSLNVSNSPSVITYFIISLSPPQVRTQRGALGQIPEVSLTFVNER